jgi:hypothetical protein
MTQKWMAGRLLINEQHATDLNPLFTSHTRQNNTKQHNTKNHHSLVPQSVHSQGTTHHHRVSPIMTLHLLFYSVFDKITSCSFNICRTQPKYWTSVWDDCLLSNKPLWNTDGKNWLLFYIYIIYLHTYIHSFIIHSVNPHKVDKPIGYRICHDTNTIRVK